MTINHSFSDNKGFSSVVTLVTMKAYHILGSSKTSRLREVIIPLYSGLVSSSVPELQERITN